MNLSSVTFSCPFCLSISASKVKSSRTSPLFSLESQSPTLVSSSFHPHPPFPSFALRDVFAEWEFPGWSGGILLGDCHVGKESETDTETGKKSWRRERVTEWDVFWWPLWLVIQTFTFFILFFLSVSASCRGSHGFNKKWDSRREVRSSFRFFKGKKRRWAKAGNKKSYWRKWASQQERDWLIDWL